MKLCTPPPIKDTVLIPEFSLASSKKTRSIAHVCGADQKPDAGSGLVTQRRHL